jgi:hypothetical protein
MLWDNCGSKCSCVIRVLTRAKAACAITRRSTGVAALRRILRLAGGVAVGEPSAALPNGVWENTPPVP